MLKNREAKITMLMDAFLQLKRSMNRHLIESDACTATPVQTEILSRIARGEDRASDIAAAMGASASAVTQHINQLVEHGFVKKTESPNDKRELVLHLTTAGRHVIETKQQLMRARIERVVAALTDEELDQFIAIANKIAHANITKEPYATQNI